jgi:hypothetical protein
MHNSPVTQISCQSLGVTKNMYLICVENYRIGRFFIFQNFRDRPIDPKSDKVVGPLVGPPRGEAKPHVNRGFRGVRTVPILNFRDIISRPKQKTEVNHNHCPSTPLLSRLQAVYCCLFIFFGSARPSSSTIIVGSFTRERTTLNASCLSLLLEPMEVYHTVGSSENSLSSPKASRK